MYSTYMYAKLFTYNPIVIDKDLKEEYHVESRVHSFAVLVISRL